MSEEKKFNVQIGNIFQGISHYGGSQHSIGLFVVTSIGKKFVSIQSIESEEIEVVEQHSDPAYSKKVTKRKAIIPIVKKTEKGSKTRFLINGYNSESNSATVSDGASISYREFTLIRPDSDNQFIYNSRSERYQ